MIRMLVQRCPLEPSAMGCQSGLFAALFGAAACANTGLADGGSPTAARVVILVLENQGYGLIIGNPDAPYLNWLAFNGAYCTGMYAFTHPSQPNYFEFFAGSNQGIQD